MKHACGALAARMFTPTSDAPHSLAPGSDDERAEGELSAQEVCCGFLCPALTFVNR
jgi:hypothetical protein